MYSQCFKIHFESSLKQGGCRGRYSCTAENPFFQLLSCQTWPHQGETSASEGSLVWGFGLHVCSRALDSMQVLGLLLSGLIRDTSHAIWVRSLYDWSQAASFGFWRSMWGVEDFPCRGTARWQLSVSWVFKLFIEKAWEGELGSDDRQREARMDSLPSDPSATVSFDTLDMDSCSSDKADSKLCSPKNFLSSSAGDEHSKLFISRRQNVWYQLESHHLARLKLIHLCWK